MNQGAPSSRHENVSNSFILPVLLHQACSSIGSTTDSSVQQPLGTSALFTCNTVRGSKPFTFEWFKDDQKLTNGFPNEQIQIETKSSYSQLTISDLTVNDSGNYSCLVSNQIGASAQWSWLQVEGMCLPMLVQLFLNRAQNVALNALEMIIFPHLFVVNIDSVHFTLFRFDSLNPNW